MSKRLLYGLADGAGGYYEVYYVTVEEAAELGRGWEAMNVENHARELYDALKDIEACANGTAPDCRPGDDAYNLGMVIGAARKAIRKAEGR
jgi:hypothetical protein